MVLFPDLWLDITSPVLNLLVLYPDLWLAVTSPILTLLVLFAVLSIITSNSPFDVFPGLIWSFWGLSESLSNVVKVLNTAWPPQWALLKRSSNISPLTASIQPHLTHRTRTDSSKHTVCSGNLIKIKWFLHG